MKRFLLLASATVLSLAVFGCTQPETRKEAAETMKNTASDAQVQAKTFLDAYFVEYSKLEKAQTLGYWKAANSGKKEDFEAFAAADLALKKLHSDAKRYAEIQAMLKNADQLEPITRRSLEVAELAFKGNQLPDELLEKMVKMSSDIELTFNTFRAELDGEKASNNQLLGKLAKAKDTAERKKIWTALKAVGAAVAPKLIALAKVRNEAAKHLGYKDYWYMSVALQEHDADKLLAIFAELKALTKTPFMEMKAKLDAEVAERLGVKVEKIMPWHYDNPFFQEPPPSKALDLDTFFKDRKKEDIVEMARAFYTDIGLPADDLIAKSDFFEREGKDQHAFCITIDRDADVRMLLNIKPTSSWMETMLHETGHGVYYKWIDRALPFNLREAAHIFTTEAVAMLFGALGKNPQWLIDYAGVPADKVEPLTEAILNQRRREQLIFSRWTLVMLNFEKAMYANPDQDLNKLWWDMVEEYQMLKRPVDRNAPDWASKPHFTIAPVYYHNYQLGEVYAAQLRHALTKQAKHEGPAHKLSYKGRKDFGKFFIDKVFAPGTKTDWPTFVKNSTGEDLTAKYFATELK
ncbi:MAG: M2 family metallopeptidase [Deltaproteobacteria bacterium]|nr:M2 family metallopeptidase [Deltaproteobacteria bacterium]